QIPDTVPGLPVDSPPPLGHPYQYSTDQLDLAGNKSAATGFGNQGAIVIDGTDSDDHGGLDANGVNSGGWIYMQKVLELIAPNVTNNNKTIVALGADPTDQSNAFGAQAAIFEAFTQSALAAAGWNIVYINTPANIQTYLSGGAANA